MKHLVEITETLQRIVEVDAENDDDAESIVREQYRLGEIVLDESDFRDVSFRVAVHADENNGTPAQVFNSIKEIANAQEKD